MIGDCDVCGDRTSVVEREAADYDELDDFEGSVWVCIHCDPEIPIIGV